eukprot:UN16633
MTRTNPDLYIDTTSSKSHTDLFSDLKETISGMESFVSRLHRQSLAYDSPDARSCEAVYHQTPPNKELDALT